MKTHLNGVLWFCHSLPTSISHVIAPRAFGTYVNAHEIAHTRPRRHPDVSSCCLLWKGRALAYFKQVLDDVLMRRKVKVGNSEGSKR